MNLFGNGYWRIMVNSKPKLSDDEISQILREPNRLTRKLQSGIYAALLKHKQAGNPGCEWRDNKVIWISAERIPTGTHKQSKKS